MKTASTAALAAALVLSSLPAAQAKAPETAASLLAQSAQALKIGHWQKGVVVSERLLELPNVTPAQTQLALNYLCIHQAKLEEFSAALAACDQSVALDPKNWVSYRNRANVLAMSGNSQAARADYAQSELLNPDQPAVYQSQIYSASTLRYYTMSFIAPAPGDAAIQQAEAK